MKVLFVVFLLLTACTRKPEFYIDGKPYYTKKTCIKSHNRIILIPHHIGKVTVMRPQNQTICDQYRIDTLEFITKK